MASGGEADQLSINETHYYDLSDNARAPRPQNLPTNPVNVGLPTADDILSPNNSRIVQRAERPVVSNQHTARANDPLELDRNPADVPENYFGNGDVSRRGTANRPSISSVDSNSMQIQQRDADCDGDHNSITPVESDPSMDEVLMHGLGLVLHEVARETVPATPTHVEPEVQASAAQNPPAHNWQSNKHSVKSRLLYLLTAGALSDVTFIVGGSSLLMSASTSTIATPERFVAHKFVLSMSSAVFDAMFNGQMAMRDDSAIEIPDVEPLAFSALLKFLYTDEISVESHNVMSILYAAKKYAIPALEQECVEFLKDNIQSENVFMLLSQARLFDEPVLASLCLESIDKNTSEALSSDGFTDIDLETLCLVLGRDSLGIRESKLFSAVTKWAEHACVREGFEITPENQRTALGKAVRLIRYPLMTVEEFAVQVSRYAFSYTTVLNCMIVQYTM